MGSLTSLVSPQWLELERQCWKEHTAGRLQWFGETAPSSGATWKHVLCKQLNLRTIAVNQWWGYKGGSPITNLHSTSTAPPTQTFSYNFTFHIKK